MRSCTAVAALALIGLAACASKPAQRVGQIPPPPSSAEAFPLGQGQSFGAGQVETRPSQSLQEALAASAGDRVHFAVDSHELSADAAAALDRQADWLRANPSVRVMIAGNCDERGTREYNIALGARRARAAADRLASRGVNPTRIETISYGKERPIEGGSNDAAWARNRNAHTMVSG